MEHIVLELKERQEGNNRVSLLARAELNENVLTVDRVDKKIKVNLTSSKLTLESVERNVLVTVSTEEEEGDPEDVVVNNLKSLGNHTHSPNALN